MSKIHHTQERHMILARYYNQEFDYDTILEVTESRDNSAEYTKISENVEVDFPDLDHATVVQNKVSLIDKKISKIQALALVKVGKLVKEKKDLLALEQL